MDFLRGGPIFGLKNREPELGRTGTGRKGGRDHQMTVSCDPDVASETSHDTKRKSGSWVIFVSSFNFAKASETPKDRGFILDALPVPMLTPC